METVTTQSMTQNPLITIISRDEIPAIHEIEQNGQIHHLGELRDFQWHELLKAFMPPNTEFSISWVNLQHNETLAVHVHPIQSMMIFYQGSGIMLGQKPQAVQAKDVVVVPAGCEHGFIGGPEGLYGFSIQFGQGLYTHPDNPMVQFCDDQAHLKQLKIYHEERLQRFLAKPFFNLFKEGILQDPDKLKIFLDCMQIWVDRHHTPLFVRSVSHYDVEHHFFDPMIEAMVDWFIYQLYVLDYDEKAIVVYWVIEQVNFYYHQLAQSQLPEHIYTLYFFPHLKIDKHNIYFDEAILQHLPISSYHRLKKILISAWDTMEILVDRVYQLTVQAG